MSSLITIQQCNAIHLIIDGAHYDDDGTVRAIGTKMVSLPVSNTVIALRGSAWAREALTVALSFAPTLDAICDCLPEVLGGVMRAYDILADADRPRRHRDFELTIAGWSGRQGAWTACIAATSQANDPESPGGFSEYDGYEPHLAYFALPLTMAPQIDAEAALGRSLETTADVAALDPERDGLVLHQAQRLLPVVSGGGRLSCWRLRGDRDC